jgi:adenosine deaminase
MTDDTVDLDRHRGMAAQKATLLRRLLTDVENDAQSLRLRQQELETRLAAAPAMAWPDAAEKARYLLELFAATPAAQDPRRQTLIANVLEDFSRLSKPEG